MSSTLQMQVVEELHLARSEKRLEVDVLHSCGELTCMDIDPPEDGAANSHCKFFGGWEGPGMILDDL